MCGVMSRLIQQTVVPTGTVSVSGLIPKVDDVDLTVVPGRKLAAAVARRVYR